MTEPCDVCHRCHRGPRCKPDDKRAQKVALTMPRHIWAALTAHVPWGERSAWIAQAVDERLERETAV